MAIKSKKESLQSRENSIKKSNEISMAELNYGLDLNQMQLLAFAIYSTQQDGKTEFRKHQFEKKFGIEQLRPNDAMNNAYRLLDMKIELRDLEKEKSRGHNVFMDYYYDNGLFSFEWNPKMIPHILDLKERYIVIDLEVASHFKSSFSWRLYEFLKGHYGYFRKELTKQEIYELFNVEERKTYQKSVSQFKRGVLDVAIKEINYYTELDVWYKEQKNGRAIVGFKIYWSKGKVLEKATDKQIAAIQGVMEAVEENMFTYAQIKNDEKRMRAFEIMDWVTNYRPYITDPIEITKTKADSIMEDLDFQLSLLNGLIDTDKPMRDTSFYYNWLEGSD